MRFLPFTLLAFLLLPSAGCSQVIAVENEDPFEGVFGYAFGHELRGEPIFTEENGRLYLNGYDYFTNPRIPSGKGSGAGAAAKAVHDIITEATASAREAATSEEWIERCTSVLDRHRGSILLDYEVRRGCIVLTCQDGQMVYRVSILVPPPEDIGRVALDPDPDEVLKEIKNHFFEEYYSKGYWVFWGEGYLPMIVPTQRLPKTKEAILSLRAGIPASQLNLEDTPFENEHCLQEFLAVERGE